jgi:hypothetical protein
LKPGRKVPAPIEHTIRRQAIEVQVVAPDRVRKRFRFATDPARLVDMLEREAFARCDRLRNTNVDIFRAAVDVYLGLHASIQQRRECQARVESARQCRETCVP